MSTISEVDIRDWDRIDIPRAKLELEHLGEWGSYVAYTELNKFFKELELLRDKQIKAATKQIPALFKPFVDAVNRGE